MSSGSRSRGERRRGRHRGSHRHGERGEPLSGGYVEIGEVAGWIAEEALDGSGGITGAMECERYASHIAESWERGKRELGVEKATAVGYGVIDRLRQSDHPFALPLLRGLAAVAEEPIDMIADEWSADPAGWGSEAPAWLSAVGLAEVSRAVRIDDPTGDGGTIVLLDLAWPDGQLGGIGVFIDPRLAGQAKHILVGPTIAESRAEIEDEEDRPWGFEELSLGDAVAIVTAAAELTERGGDPRVGETYASQRDFLRAQLKRIGGSAEP